MAIQEYKCTGLWGRGLSGGREALCQPQLQGQWRSWLGLQAQEGVEASDAALLVPCQGCGGPAVSTPTVDSCTGPHSRGGHHEQSPGAGTRNPQ